MESGELRLDLQPVIDSRTGEIASAEALLRLQHRQYGVVNPDEILAAVAGTAQQVELDRWVITEGVRALRRLREIAPGFRVDVNVTAALLNTSGVVEFIGKHTGGLPDGAFGIEVSEQDSFARLETSASKLSALRRRGIGVALDDFGTGASSLACVTLPFDTIKIDRSFVQRVEEDAASRGVCIAVAAIAEAVGALVIAEGVETEAHIGYLNDLGVQYHQGWFYAKAMRFEDLANRLASR
jgi:EAL domain-containing protein (putative c-di-GMP-specific phosphodiesterase class I)